jgi:isopropylmalate/homocitrate/citramalate synthase
MTQTKSWLSGTGSVSPETDQAPTKSPLIYDVTLRDGEQQAGIIFSVADKVEIFQSLDAAGVPYIETGMIAVAAEETEVVRRVLQTRRQAKVFVLCRAIAGDVGMAHNAGADGASIEIVVNPDVVSDVMKWGPNEAEERARDAVIKAKELGLIVNLFLVDATRTRATDLAAFARNITATGAVDTITLADTFGVADPTAIDRYVRALREGTGLPVWVHCHSDLGLGVANTLAGLRAGAFGAHASINGIGERAGNAPLEDVVMALHTLYGVDTGIDITKLRAISKLVAERAGTPVAANKSVVGPQLFDIESGIAATFYEALKDTDLRYFYGYLPASLGATVAVRVGKGSGVSNLRLKAAELNRPDLITAAAALVTAVKAAAIAKGRLLTDEEFLEVASVSRP